MGFHTKPATFVGHVKIKVEKLERSLKFYQEILGFGVLEQTTTTAMLTTDGKTSFLSLEQPENVIPKQGRTTGLFHFAILLPKRSDLANIVIHFRENGIRLMAAEDHQVSEALYLNDPEGNGIEIYVDRDPSSWIWKDTEVDMTTIPLNMRNLLSSLVPGESWKGMPEGAVMGHIHLHVTELVQTEEFYGKGLGFDVVNRYKEEALFLSTEKYHHHVAVNIWNGIGAPTPPENSVGLESFTLILPNEEARLQVVTNLKQIGAFVKEENNLFVTHDPSGNRIKLAI
ncbi:VOC family protein [Ammoniphilus resinae]|uniref:Catechol 2,3-dioxygenase n=1 Tax=Ammoniphilus resinae TaxID=861532 RepID=A0ABS4GVM8_9BACL|nr:VOC family protein [Ammoniphilus resinae]MBP1934333.1 catechol 2,3-dioxygenase [Ammoniphilus resinae]